jgi:AmmeMemoRadiSam system protein B
MITAGLRKPVVAGQFYPAGAQELKNLIASLADGSAPKQKVIGCILPHAGYVYSGRVACQTAAAIKIQDTVVLLGPNHTGMGAVFSIMPQGIWQTPLGNLEIDRQLADRFLDKSRYLKNDALAHANEHSLEVELPILQYFRNDFKIVPIIIATDDLTRLGALGEDLAAVIIENNLQDKVTLVASSDLTHYEPQASAKIKDRLAIEAILALDEQELQNRVEASKISMCGFAPVAVLLKAAKALGAKNAKLIKYQTSGDCPDGDFSRVVGYAGITIS